MERFLKKVVIFMIVNRKDLNKVRFWFLSDSWVESEIFIMIVLLLRWVYKSKRWIERLCINNWVDVFSLWRL